MMNTSFLKTNSFRYSFILILILVKFAILYYLFWLVRQTPIVVKSRYSYYICTQIYNESDNYLFDWLDHQFNVVGFKNVCLINTGPPLSASIRKQFPFAYVQKANRLQEFEYCLSSCFVDKPMRPEDMLMIHDIDEYLNVRKADEISINYKNYDQFHFHEIRYGNLNFCFLNHTFFMLLFRLRHGYRYGNAQSFIAYY
jgi:hypothetical protein